MIVVHGAFQYRLRMDAVYHRRRADQHRRMLDVGDPQYASIHRRMIALHEARAAECDGAQSGEASGQLVAPGP